MDDTPTSPLSGSMRKSHILIVDDDVFSRGLLSRILDPYYQVTACATAAEALALLSGPALPDLALLDVLMPGMDGFEMLRWMQEKSLTAEVPVIFVTGLNDPDSEQRGLELGAADYLHKPIQRVVVLSRVRTQLEAKAARDMLRRATLRLKDQVSEGAHALEQAQDMLVQAEKMVAIGQLAAGVAHEINNPVGYVGSNITALEGYIKDFLRLIDAYEQALAGTPTPEDRSAIADIKNRINYDFVRSDMLALLSETQDGIQRVRRIVSDLKDHAHVSDDDWGWADIHHGLDSTLNIVWNELKYHCTVVKNYGELPEVRCLISQLNQVFMNLFVNAAQAIEGNGTITITTERVGDDAVRITIADTGSGIAPESLSRIFDPFFTTKPVGKGTGLGLPLSRGIVERHHGRIDVTSEVGQGTTFAITLPVDALAAAEAAQQEHGKNTPEQAD